MSSQNSAALQNQGVNQSESKHESAIDLEGLDHLFKWASEMVAEGEDNRVRQTRDKRVRREVLEVVQQARESKVVTEALDEASYLQRRVIALLQKMTEVTEENAAIKQIMVSQYYTLQRIPYLETQVKQMRTLEFERDAAVTERRYLMDALAKLKTERDLLDDMVTSCESENIRVAKLFQEAKLEVETLQAKRWWHNLVPRSWIA